MHTSILTEIMNVSIIEYNFLVDTCKSLLPEN